MLNFVVYDNNTNIVDVTLHLLKLIFIKCKSILKKIILKLSKNIYENNTHKYLKNRKYCES